MVFDDPEKNLQKKQTVSAVGEHCLRQKFDGEKLR